uniref:Transmembrane protein 216 n=1 Tax=Taeniopygia guttata TaxID=59729 RepID=H0Z7Y6_TAEGU
MRTGHLIPHPKPSHDVHYLIPALCSTGSKGNLCQRKVPLSLSLALTVPAAVLAVYYLLLQTYSLRLEAFLSAILLLFYGLELLLGFLALLSFSRIFSPLHYLERN